MWPEGGIGQILPTCYHFLFSQLTPVFFTFLSSLLSCFFLPSRLCVAATEGLHIWWEERVMCCRQGRHSLCEFSDRGAIRGLWQASPLIGGSPPTALYRTVSQGLWSPTWRAAGVLEVGFRGAGESWEKNEPLDYTSVVRPENSLCSLRPWLLWASTLCTLVRLEPTEAFSCKFCPWSNFLCP